MGPSSFLLNAGDLSAYTFNASDDGGEQVQVNILGGLPANATLLQIDSTTYTFTWRLSDPNHVSNLTFYASDSFGVVGVLSPEIVVCACQNGGNCTTEGVLSAQNNVMIMNCICPSGMHPMYVITCSHNFQPLCYKMVLLSVMAYTECDYYVLEVLIGSV